MQPLFKAVSPFTRTALRLSSRLPLLLNLSYLRAQPQQLLAIQQSLRHNSSPSFKNAIPEITEAKPHRPAPHRDPNTPVYELTFTCRPCGHRSAHTVSKQGYHKGTTLITCPSCKNRHLISDHLRIFTDKPTTLEDLLREQGDAITKGSIDPNGDIEYWPDESATAQESSNQASKSMSKA